ncbi:alpha-hydroxy acid oxidase [Aquabacterium sp. A3]|uniref:alpha-hydroxy acid oxidase n=1 Tax=Aquabacterium sp. A3 TaxID=3132829 RepID=UPI003119BDE1
MSTPALPPGVVSLADYEGLAQQHLSDATWAWLAGGAADEHTVRANTQAWAQWRLWPRVMQPLAGGHTRRTLLGRTLAHPLMLAPVALHRAVHADGELGVACAASAQQAGLVLSTQASTPLESVAQAIRNDADRGPLWMQMYLQHDRGFNTEFVRRIEAAGYEALVLTVDAPCSGVRDRERRAGPAAPPGVSAVNLQGLRMPEAQALPPGGSALFDGLLRHAPTWDDIAWLQGLTHLPILLKGVLHPADAQQAQSMGLAGVIVSNHGGRTLDTAVSTAWALPQVVDAVGPDWPVLVDGGIRRGTDVFKALALGAHAVLIGRPYLHGLAVAGALGVAHVIRLLRDELEIAMALNGCRTLSDIRRAHLVPGPRA